MSKLFAKKESATTVDVRENSEIVNTDHRSYTRMGWVIVLLGVGGFLAWASFAPLDKGVPLPGTVTVATARKAVQHLQGGTVQDILVKEGDAVKAGQELVRMNDVQTRSQAEITRVQYYSARVAEARLVAERDGKSALTFPPELEAQKNDERVATNMKMQAQLFQSRQQALQNELAALDQSVAGLKSQIQGLELGRDSKKAQLKLLKEQLSGIRELTADGFVARNRMLELERSLEQLNGAIAEDIGNIGRVRTQIAELALRRTLRQQEYQKEVRSLLSEVQRDADALQSRLIAQDFDLSNASVRAPAEGIIVGMNVFTKGGVVPAGFRMMDIVPKNDALIVEGQVPVHMIDKVKIGLEVELMFSAFDQNKTPKIPGKVTYVSSDRLTDDKTGQPYFKLKAEVAGNGLQLLRDAKIQPGMPVDVFVKTGERTLMSYLLKPLLDRGHTSMSEE